MINYIADEWSVGISGKFGKWISQWLSIDLPGHGGLMVGLMGFNGI